jgi:hypothetical protein
MENVFPWGKNSCFENSAFCRHCYSNQHTQAQHTMPLRLRHAGSNATEGSTPPIRSKAAKPAKETPLNDNVSVGIFNQPVAQARRTALPPSQKQAAQPSVGLAQPAYDALLLPTDT